KFKHGVSRSTKATTTIRDALARIAGLPDDGDPMLDANTPARRLAWVPVLAATLAACTGTMIFSDTSPLVVTGAPPAPPPAPEAKPEPPPQPKRVEVTEDKIVINDKILFDYNKSTIKPESFGLLDEIASVI